MAAAATKSDYEYLEARSDSFYRELFLRGLNLRASRLVAWMQCEELTPEQAATDRGLPLEAVLEAIEYVKSNVSLIAEEIEREHQLLRDRGLLQAEGS